MKKTINVSQSLDEESPIRAIFCLKKKSDDMKKIEEIEDCFILDFDPFEPTNLSSPLPAKHLDFLDDFDISILSEKGQVACRDYPHPRHLCAKFPFEKTPHESHCNMCYCHVCEVEAPCKEWTTGLKHCDATKDKNQI
ncbi:unnamed protein product [Amaranthus hypochondriacus]